MVGRRRGPDRFGKGPGTEAREGLFDCVLLLPEPTTTRHRGTPGYSFVDDQNTRPPSPEVGSQSLTESIPQRSCSKSLSGVLSDDELQVYVGT